MALHLNLHHEIQRQRAVQARDPLKLSMFGLGFVAVLFAGYYAWQLGIMSSLSKELARQKAELAVLEPQAKAAQARVAELAVTVKTSDTLLRRIEGRFYWAPILQRIAQIVPGEVQLTKLAAETQGDSLKKCSLTIDGIAAGADARRVAEDLRTALAEELSKAYGNVTSSFRSLEDGTETVLLDGQKTPTAAFAINLQLTSGSETMPPVAAPRLTKKK